MPATVRSISSGGEPCYDSHTGSGGGESTPPSTRPSSSASTSSSGLHHHPLRASSMDSLLHAGASAGLEKGEHVPTRTVGAGPKSNSKAMIFVKTGPAQLYKSATEQMKKAQTVKALRRQAVQEEEEEPDWQQKKSAAAAAMSEDTDWQSNLDKWKKNRRRRNEDVLERVIEVKKFESENDMNQTRRKSKTFSEMREDTGKRGRRFNLVIHDDDDNNLDGLGLSGGGGITTEDNNAKNTSSSSSSNSSTINNSPPLSLTTTETTNSSRSTTIKEHTTSAKEILLMDHDNKDTKSDAGFCTGSDTGSDGLFPEDNISDTSSALGDKKETHDSLLDAGIPSKDDDLSALTASSMSSVGSSSVTRSSVVTKQETMEYTYDKAIEGYKQYAENSVKKRTASMTSLNSVSSGSAKFDDRSSKYDKDTSYRSTSPSKAGKIGDKLDFFVKEMDKEFSKPTPKPIVVMREKSPKIDITKRKTMFEIGQSTSTVNLTNIDNKLDKRRSSDMTASTGNLKNKVASFENFELDSTKQKGVTPPRDTKFKEKLANFSAKGKEDLAPAKKKTPEKDKNFHQKLASFTNLENVDESNKYFERRPPAPLLNTSLKSKIASFEQLDQQDQDIDFRMTDGSKSREKSVSMECLTRSSASGRREMKFNKGSVDTLDEETTENNRSSSNSWRPPQPTRSRLSKSPEKRSLDSSSVEKVTTKTSVSERRSIMEQHSIETKPEIQRSHVRQQSFEKDVDESLSRKEFVGRILPTCPPVPKDSCGSRTVPCPPLDIEPLDMTTTQTEAPISTSSPRMKSEYTDDKVFSSDSSTTGGVASESSRIVSGSFMSTTSTLLSSSMNSSEIIKRNYENALNENHYDDVINTVDPSSLMSSMESDRIPYTDDDINEVIGQFEADATENITSHYQTIGADVRLSKQVKDRASEPASTPLETSPKRILPSVPSFGGSQSSGSAGAPSKQSSLDSSHPVIGSYKPPSAVSLPAVGPKASSAVSGAAVTSPSVVFVDWSESGGPVAPPTEAPPPPPSDDEESTDSDQDNPPDNLLSERTVAVESNSRDQPPVVGELQATSPTPSDCPSLVPSEVYASSDCSNSTRNSAREELRKRRSDFLGTSRYSEDVAPGPSGLDVLLEQQRLADQQMMEARRTLQQTSAQVLSDIDQSRSRQQSQQQQEGETDPQQQGGNRGRYTWEDRLRDDTTLPSSALNDTDDGYGYQNVSTTGKTSLEVSTTVSDSLPNTVLDSNLISNADIIYNADLVLNLDIYSKVDQTPKAEVVANFMAVPNAVPDGIFVASDDSKIHFDGSHDVNAGLDSSENDEMSGIGSNSLETPATPTPSTPASSTPLSPSNQTTKVPNFSDESVSEEKEKLAQLEAEMMQHDRSVLNRARPPHKATAASTTTIAAAGGTVTTSNGINKTNDMSVGNVIYDDVAAPTTQSYQDPQGYIGGLMSESSRMETTTSTTNGYHYYSSTNSNECYNGHQQQDSNPYQQETNHHQIQQHEEDVEHHGQYGVVSAPDKPVRTYNTCYDSSAPDVPDPLPRMNMAPPSPPPEEERRQESTDPSNQQNLSKQSRHALSAIPRSRLNDGESWIKRKPEVKRDYSKHWLIQEAEQRRLEQRDTRHNNRGDQKPIVPSPTYSHQPTVQAPLPTNPKTHYTPSYADTTTSSSHSSYVNRALDPTAATTRPVDHSNSSRPPLDPVNRVSDPNAWRNQATTYQPLPSSSAAGSSPSSADKPLPDSIINTLTQRVNNKSRPSSANNSSGRPSPYNASMSGSNSNLHYASSVNNYSSTTTTTTTDENYHDYMNADALNLQHQQQYSNYYSQQQSPQSSQQHQQDNQQNQLYANYPPKPFNNNNQINNNNNNHEHYTHQNHKVSPTNSQPPSHSPPAIPPQQPIYQSNQPHQKLPQSSPTHSQSSKNSTKGSPNTTSTSVEDQQQQNLVSVSGKKKCSHCSDELGRGAAMIIESLRLFYHIPCFVCCVCGLQLGNGKAGADVRVRNHALHCQNCYSNDKGMKFSEV